jgi:hypothetical protein
MDGLVQRQLRLAADLGCFNVGQRHCKISGIDRRVGECVASPFGLATGLLISLLQAGLLQTES